jgi:hypothetical protein
MTPILGAADLVKYAKALSKASFRFASFRVSTLPIAPSRAMDARCTNLMPLGGLTDGRPTGWVDDLLGVGVEPLKASTTLAVLCTRQRCFDDSAVEDVP